MRLTRRGIGTAVTALALIVFARMTTIRELLVVGLSLAGLVLSAMLRSRHRIEVALARHVSPQEAHVGDTVSVVLELTNLSRWSSPTVTVVDAIGTQSVRRWVGPLRTNASATMSYEAKLTQRGEHQCGPVRFIAADPFGLVVWQADAPSVSRVLALPRVELLQPTWSTIGPADQRPRAAALRQWLQHDQDFSGLRPFQAGDDVRRVHWPTSARVGTPVVRTFDDQAELPVIVLLDIRADHHNEASFETAVSAAASLVSSYQQSEQPVRFVTTAGTDSGLVRSAADRQQVMDQLARITTTSAASTLPGGLDRQAALVFVCTGAVPHGATVVASESWLTIELWCGAIAPTEAGRVGASQFHFAPDRTLQESWIELVARRGVT